jgi:hypothetical protein
MLHLPRLRCLASRLMAPELLVWRILFVVCSTGYVACTVILWALEQVMRG